MSKLPRYLRTKSERFREARDVLSFSGALSSSKGGRAKADKVATALATRNEMMRSDFDVRMKAPNAQRRKVIAGLAKKYKLSRDRVNRLLRQ
jgi:hypothetical protein